MSALENRLRHLEAIAAIHELKARYAAFADAKYAPTRQLQPEPLLRAAAMGQAACFTEDAVWEAGDGFGGALIGRPALEAWFAQPPWRFAMHLYVAPMLSFDGDEAVARWRLWQVGVRPDEDGPVLLLGITEETCRRQPSGDWLIARMRFEQLHTIPMAPRTLDVLLADGPKP